MPTINNRNVDYGINEIFARRWSPRAMSGEAISDEELMILFEAARWAPSSYNNQPWRFIYARKNTEHWQKFFDLLVEFNQSWCKDAGVLVLVISKKNFEYNGKPSRTHAFDTGSAVENFALQASLSNLVAHGMEGFDYDKAREVFGIPDDYEILCMYAIGKPGRKEDLPAELQKQEVQSTRKKVSEFVAEGEFKGFK